MFGKFASHSHCAVVATSLYILFACFVVGSSYAEPPLIPIVDNSWIENYDKTRPVSGDLYVGSIVGEAERQVDPAQLLVHLPLTNSPKLCVEIISRDARYYARSEYDISGRSTGIYRIELPTKLPKKLKDYRADEVGVRADLRDDCDQLELTSLIPVSWGIPKNTGRATIQLNTSEVESKLIIPKNSQDAERQIITCHAVDSGRRKTSFDTLCSLSVTDLSQLCEITLRRQHFGHWLPDKKLRIFCRS